MADGTDAPKDLIGFLEYHLVTNAPFQLPDGVRTVLAAIVPWLVLLGTVLAGLVASNIRFATERYWLPNRVWSRLPATLGVIGTLVWVVPVGRNFAEESWYLNAAAAEESTPAAALAVTVAT